MPGRLLRTPLIPHGGRLHARRLTSLQRSPLQLTLLYRARARSTSRRRESPRGAALWAWVLRATSVRGAVRCGTYMVVHVS